MAASQKIPLGNYLFVSASYVSIEDGGGTLCENCGRLITHIVTVKHENGKCFCIGQDCATTLFDKQTNGNIDNTLKTQKRTSKKIKELIKYDRPYVLNEKGIPCHPPETRSGYFIPY